MLYYECEIIYTQVTAIGVGKTYTKTNSLIELSQKHMIDIYEIGMMSTSGTKMPYLK